MNKFILLTILIALSYNAAWANPTAVEIREYVGSLDMSVNALKTKITQQTDAASSKTYSNVAVSNAASCTTCAGKNAEITFTQTASAAASIQVVTAGSGYKAGDTIELTSANILASDSTASSSTALVITLTIDDINNGGLAVGAAFTSKTASITDATENNNNENLATTTNGVGSGAILSVAIGAASGGLAPTVTVIEAGKGYAVDDTITIDKSLIAGSSSGAATANLVITLKAADLNNGHLISGRLKSGAGLLRKTTSITAATESTNNPNLATTTNGAGSGAILTVAIGAASGGLAPTVTIVNVGEGYVVGDTITVAKALITGSDSGGASVDLVITLTAADFEGASIRYPKTHVDDSFFNSIGANMPWDETTPTLTGYHVPLAIPTNYISVVASFTAGTVVPQIGSNSDTGLIADEISTLLYVKDGLNVLKLVSSEDGTYQIYLVKPETQIKDITTSKRSITISYTPAAAGEFTCSAFDGSNTIPFTDPVDRDEVKTLSGVVTKSTRTNNILVKNMFKSLQLTLNGLTPYTAHEIHCYHAAHGIISKGSQITTQLGSLTGVSLTASTPAAGAGSNSPGVLTLTFTHEKSLLQTNTIKLTLYDGYDGLQAITTASGCAADFVTVRTGGPSGTELAVQECTVSATKELVLELSSGQSSTVASASSGTQIVITLTDDTKLNFADNAVANTEVLFDLEVTGHGKLLKQYAYKTT